MPRASEHPGYKQRFPKKVTLEEIEGKIFTMSSAEVREGDEGKFAICHGGMDDYDDPLVLITGAMLIVPFIADCIEDDFFPVDCRFYKVGKTWNVD